MTLFKHIANRQKIKHRQDKLFTSWMGSSPRFAFSSENKKIRYGKFMELVKYHYEQYYKVESLQLKLNPSA